jgi:hypothetical protein
MPDFRSSAQLAEYARSHIADAILQAIGKVPQTAEHKIANPEERAREIASSAATRAGLAAGTMAAPPGLSGLLTLVPELMTVWRIQTQMVADIAGVYGHASKLTREQMIYCLFEATAGKTVSALVVMIGESVAIRRPTLRALQGMAANIGFKVIQRLLGRGIVRWMPLVGAVSVGAFAYYETSQVAETAIGLFEKPIDVEGKATRAKPTRRLAPARKPKGTGTAKSEPTKRKLATRKRRPGAS